MQLSGCPPARFHAPRPRPHQRHLRPPPALLPFLRAVCCPARASILAGQCAHNSGIVSLVWPLGGARKFAERGLETKALPYLLQKAGYRTGLLGK